MDGVPVGCALAVRGCSARTGAAWGGAEASRRTGGGVDGAESPCTGGTLVSGVPARVGRGPVGPFTGTGVEPDVVGTGPDRAGAGVPGVTARCTGDGDELDAGAGAGAGVRVAGGAAGAGPAVGFAWRVPP
ncbi:hypothetical protein ACFU9F_32560 [Streptomyces zhihengii]|uniref:hypothetical protein n=1 Tax=Streptomyces zhihengii TaxID=1818004 RepID=UPI00368EABE3